MLRALDQDPTNIVLMSFVGGLAEQQQQFDKAAEWYLKAVSAKPEDFDANFSLGRTYYNQAVELTNSEKVTKLTEDKAKELFGKAIPYLKVAYKEKPSTVYYVLANIYDRLGMKADYDRIMAENQ